jgi:calcineurin-like phosphoesterase family protein
MWFDYAGLTFYLAHDPAIYTAIENIPNTVLLCGHIHNLFKHLLPDKRVINVGVDVWEHPPSMEQIIDILISHGIRGKK